MKLSLAWIFDHIKEKSSVRPFTDEFAKRVHELLGARTTEIDSFVRIDRDLGRFTLAQLKEIKGDTHVLHSPELRKDCIVAPRKDAIDKSWYLLVKQSKQYRYAMIQDLHGEKEGLVPELWCLEDDRAGGWKKQIDSLDYLIAIDNKAITHRPDLWGHRGFAREVAALCNMNLIPEETLETGLPIRHYVDHAQPTKDMAQTLSIDGTACRRLAAMTIAHITMVPSTPWMAFRLALVGGRPLHAVVDCTNYVMFDIGQPMHAFDAHTVHDKLEARLAKAGERLTLLDGETITLTAEDCIIADEQKPLALAGIMGGRESSLSLQSTSLLVESANFDADYIRLSAVRHKRRTESSTRFEKGLDQNQNTSALLRFNRLLNDLNITYRHPTAIISLGHLATEHVIEVSHAFIVGRIGAPIASDMMVHYLTKLGFGVTVKMRDKQIWYFVTVPTFRCTKDVLYKEDVVEEVVRMIGYDSLVPQLPTRLMRPFDQSNILKMRALKRHCAFGLHMHEVNNYALYDEAFLKQVHYDPQKTLVLKNPVSENWRRMVTSLIPHLFKQVTSNIPRYEQVNLFEINNTWQLMPNNDATSFDAAQDERVNISNTIIERKKIGMIFFSYKKSVDFYEGKAQLQSLFDLLKMMVIWQKPFTEKELEPWCLPEQTAELVCGDTIIGYAGKASPVWLHAIGEGDAFIVELDAQFLLDYHPQPLQYHALSKYQSVDLDISLLMPAMITVDDITSVIAQADMRIVAIHLRDFFEKPEWKGQRSITMRFTVVDYDKTLTKEEIDDVWESVVKNVQAKGAQVR